MRSDTPRYPVDRYLVESSKKIELVNITDDEVWNPEPALRPEDEIILRKLHDMLQSTADDLRILSGELSKFHEPGVQIKTQPTPLDEEFNEKVHIEELVNAKFHGYKIVDKTTPSPVNPRHINELKPVEKILLKPKVSTGVQVNSVVKKPVINRNLGITHTKVIEIEENKEGSKNGTKLNNGKVISNMPAVAYNEFSFKYVEPKPNILPQKKLQVQDMPKINIRSELRQQKVLQLDIIPEVKVSNENLISKSNIAVIAVDHETEVIPKQKFVQPNQNYQLVHYPEPSYSNKQPIRRVSKMSTCESSGSTNNVSSDTQHKLKTQMQIKTVIRSSPKNSARIDRKNKKTNINKKETEQYSRLNLDEWKRKLNTVYGQPSTSRGSKLTSKSNVKRTSPKKSNLTSVKSAKLKSNILNNAEYIPYSHLTLGGVRVSDIEREIGDVPNRNDIPLSPILDKILSSKENSFHHDSPRKSKKTLSPKILTTSDENLLQEVIDIERSVNKTITKNFKKKENQPTVNLPDISNSNENSESNKNDSYADDFEDDKSDDDTQRSEKKTKSSIAPSVQKSSSNKNSSDENDYTESDNDDRYSKPERSKSQTAQDATYTKALNLSFKNSVDVFEFVHEVDTQDTATQSNANHKISLKETQTSPTNDTQNIQPIHNDLWPSIDPQSEVEKMFKLEKDLIKKLIIDEYGDLLEKNITKPSTSKESKACENQDKNVAAIQKNTQTSPAHVKSVMTSPTRTKTRTTSPFVPLTVDRQTSPMLVITNDEQLHVEINDNDDGISINLSSPRFSLRLPQTSREILSNLEVSNTTIKVEKDKRNRAPNKSGVRITKTSNKSTPSSSSVDGDDNSSSEISSLGEIKLKLKRRLRKSRIPTISESSSSSNLSKYSSEGLLGGILPLRSEGELSIGQVRRNINVASKSEGETSFGQF